MFKPSWLWFLGAFVAAIGLAGGDYLFSDSEITIQTAMFFPLGLIQAFHDPPNLDFISITV
jgi:hypothetical protein